MSDNLSTIEDEVLSDLAHKLVDQVALYGLAKEIASDPVIAAAIQRFKEARGLLLQEINGKIWQHGIAPIDQGTKLGAAHKAFDRLRAMTEKSDDDAIAEIGRGEEYLHDRSGRGRLRRTARRSCAKLSSDGSEPDRHDTRRNQTASGPLERQQMRVAGRRRNFQHAALPAGTRRCRTRLSRRLHQPDFGGFAFPAVGA